MMGGITAGLPLSSTRRADARYRVLLDRMDTAIDRDTRLTTAQREVARLVARGMTISEIATRRDRSRRTITNQRNAIYDRLDVHSPVQLLRVLLGAPPVEGRE